MDKIKIRYTDGKTAKRNYPDDSIPWDTVEEIEILPGAIAPGSMAELCRGILERTENREKTVVRIGVVDLTEEARKARNAYCRKWRQKNRERVNAYCRKWRHDNPEHVKEYRRAYIEKNREKINAYNKKWQHDNPEKVRQYNERTWARKAEEMKQA